MRGYVKLGLALEYQFFNSVMIAVDHASGSCVQRRLFELAADQLPHSRANKCSAFVYVCVGAYFGQIRFSLRTGGTHLGNKVIR